MSAYRSISSQEELDEIVEWYRHAIGVAHWRIKPIFMDPAMSPDNHGQCDTWPNHPNAIVSLQLNDPDNKRWSDHLDDEETAVHELVHVSLSDYWDLVETVLDNVPIKQVRRVLRRLLRAEHERMVTRIARSMTALARAERDGPPPSIGEIVRVKSW